MKLKRSLDDKVEVSTASLNDIMFFLLLFFLIVATFANPNVIKLMLPKAKASQTISKKQITLSITADMKYYIDTREVSLVGLETQLSVIKKGMPDVTVIVRAAGNISVQDLVDVLQIGAQYGIKMVLATQKQS
jgi:biopolymer transport protein ExbD